MRAPLRIDASAVETLTLPCIQIILAATQSREAISIENPSVAFVSAFEDLGIDWMQLSRCDQDEQDQTQDQAQDQSRRRSSVQQAPMQASTQREVQSAAIEHQNE